MGPILEELEKKHFKSPSGLETIHVNGTKIREGPRTDDAFVEIDENHFQQILNLRSNFNVDKFLLWLFKTGMICNGTHAFQRWKNVPLQKVYFQDELAFLNFSVNYLF